MRKFSQLICTALLLGANGPAQAAVALAMPATASLEAPVTATPVVRRLAKPAVVEAPATQTTVSEVPDAVLFGMAVTGLLIVGIAARRRQPGRSVSS